MSNSPETPKSSAHFPKVPARPVLSLTDFGWERTTPQMVADSGQIKFTVNARTALAHALLHAEVDKGSSVLVPALHCPSMVSPLVWLGMEPIFYPIRPDMSVDVEALSRFVRSDTRVLIAVHYFGFVQDMLPLRKFCDSHGLILIEDCAHAFFGEFEGQPLGRQGDYAIASIMKFLPIAEGGCLVSARRSLDTVKITHGGPFFQIKSIVNALELACAHGRLAALAYVVSIKDRLWLQFKRQQSPLPISANGSKGDQVLDADYIFDSSKLGIHMSKFSTAVFGAVSISRACARRRANFLRLQEGLEQIHGGKALFPSLPTGVYPQVFPMLIDEPAKVFPLLKQQGVPIIRFGEFRWKGVDGTVCPISDELSRRVFQFPCHQSLTDKEIDWLIETISSILSNHVIS